MLDSIHPQPIAPIYERRPPLWFFHKVPEEMWLREIQPLNAPFGNNAAVVGLLLSVSCDTPKN